MDWRCRESEGKAKIEGYMSVSDEETHQRKLLHILREVQCMIVLQLNCLRKLYKRSTIFDNNLQHLRVLFKNSRANLNILASLCASAEIHL